MIQSTLRLVLVIARHRHLKKKTKNKKTEGHDVYICRS